MKNKLTYKDEIVRAMNFLSQDPRVLFMGQSVAYPGNSIYRTLQTIDDNKKWETPVFEELQMGIALGMAMEGIIPVTCYPRWDFLLCATNQLVNHVDKLETMTRGIFNGGVIIRTAVGASKPLDSGVQHTQNHTKAFEYMLTNTEVHLLEHKDQIYPAYEKAYRRAVDAKRPSLLVEYGEYYSH
tara:strand:- start:5414 stop:5965 length:552 start_codon:yes stop_codon:yes gene_type:complete